MKSQALSAVADTGPLIHLAEIGCLQLLKIFDELHIPKAVWQEALSPSKIRQKLNWAKRHNLDRQAVANYVVANSLHNLQAGDRESLFLASALKISNLLTDDLEVRDASKKLGLTPVGSLGIIVTARNRGRVSTLEAQRYLEQLDKVSSLYATSAIIDAAYKRLRETEAP